MLDWKSKQNKALKYPALKKSKSPICHTETKWIKEYPNWWQYLLNILLFDRQQGCWGWLTGERCVITGSPLINRGHLGSVVRMSISTILCLTPSTDTHVHTCTPSHPPTQTKDLSAACAKDGCFDIKTSAADSAVQNKSCAWCSVRILYPKWRSPFITRSNIQELRNSVLI